jgi:hypothetical protein
VHTSQETHYISATESNWLMLYGETVVFIVETARNTQIYSVGRMQSVPHRKHITSSLQNPAGYCCLGRVTDYCENHTEHTDKLCGQNAVRTSQETFYVFATEPKRLMLFGETKVEEDEVGGTYGTNGGEEERI